MVLIHLYTSQHLVPCLLNKWINYCYDESVIHSLHWNWACTLVQSQCLQNTAGNKEAIFPGEKEHYSKCMGGREMSEECPNYYVKFGFLEPSSDSLKQKLDDGGQIRTRSFISLDPHIKCESWGLGKKSDLPKISHPVLADLGVSSV